MPRRDLSYPPQILENLCSCGVFNVSLFRLTKGKGRKEEGKTLKHKHNQRPASTLSRVKDRMTTKSALSKRFLREDTQSQNMWE